MNAGRKTQAAARRGEPLLVLGLVLGGWCLARAATWTSPLPPDTLLGALSEAWEHAPASLYSPGKSRQSVKGLVAAPDLSNHAAAHLNVLTEPSVSHASRLTAMAGVQLIRVPASMPEALVPSPVPVPARLSAGHAMLMVAGFAQMKLAPEIARHLAPVALTTALTLPGVPAAAPLPAAAGRSAAPQRRWSGDGWLMLRDDSTGPVTSGRPSYGRSQAGAVLRYDLSTASRHLPQAHLRGALALQGAREQEVALGLSARPLGWLPLRLAAEARVTDGAGGTLLRPAVYTVSELPPQEMPGGLVGEVYAQAGYIGGRDATAFVDGLIRVERPVAAAPDLDLRAGAGVWGGAQREGARLDVGPGTTLRFRLGDARARLSADYRFRVAGDAEPASGAAFTLSAGF